MDDIKGMAVDIAENIFARIRKAISFDMTQTQLIRVVVCVILYISVIRPWMLKLAEREGVKQLAAMEKRDKDKKERQAREAPVHNLRGHRKQVDGEEEPDQEQVRDSVKTPASVNSNDQTARQRIIRPVEEELLTAEDIRAQNLENWDEDQEFLKYFSKTSDRSHA